jgi:hypothetical protein
LKVPSPDFNSRLNLNPFTISAPKINVSINLESAKFTELPRSFTKLNDTLKQAKPLYRREETLWSISEVFNKIKKSIQQ